MNLHPLRLLALVMACAVALAAPVRPVAAQGNAEPAVVISITNTNELMSDINYLLTAAGVPQYGAMINLFGGPFLQELDGSKPAGVMIAFQGMEPKPIGFLPVKNLDALLQKVQEQVGKPEDAGNGVKKIGLDRPMFLKQSNGFVFLSDSQAGLGALPSDPSTLLDGLDKTYDIAVRVHVRNIPEPLRNMAVSEMRSAFERQMAAQHAGGPEDREVQEKMSRNAINSMVRLVEESNEVTIGWAIDSENKSTYLDMSLTAVAGSELAKQMAQLQTASTNYAGFLMPNAAFNLNFNGKMSENDIQQAVTALDAMTAQAKTHIDDDQGLPNDEARQKAKGIIDRLMGIARKTVQGGILDVGAAVMLDSSSPQLVAGGRVANPGELEQVIRDVLDLAKDQPDVPRVNFNVATHKGVALHTMNVPIPPDDDARKVLGDSLDITLGLGAQSAFVAVGKGNMDLLKQIIDKAGVSAPAPPMQIIVSLKQIMKFAATLENSPPISAMNAALDAAGDKDHIRITAKYIDNGAQYRLEIEEGVLQAVGRAAAGAAQNGGNGF